MNTPLGRICFWETKGNQKTKIHEWTAGSTIWKEQGFVFAIRMRTKEFLKGTIQKTGVVDIVRLN